MSRAAHILTLSQARRGKSTERGGSPPPRSAPPELPRPGSPEEVAAKLDTSLADLFAALDGDGDGVITRDEFFRGLAVRSASQVSGAAMASPPPSSPRGVQIEKPTSKEDESRAKVLSLDGLRAKSVPGAKSPPPDPGDAEAFCPRPPGAVKRH
jgi:hypothetical protein